MSTRRVVCLRSIAGVLALAGAFVWQPPVSAQPEHSVARDWNEEQLAAIRRDFARPTIHARNLYHVSAAMWDAWAAYDANATQVIHEERAASDDVEAAREETISFAAYRVLRHRYQGSPRHDPTHAALDALMDSLGYDRLNESVDGDTPAALGNRIAASVIAFGLADGSNEANGYANQYYMSINPALIVTLTGNLNVIDPNRFQPLSLEFFIDQNGNIIPGGFPPALSPEWGNVTPFSLSENDLTEYIDRSGDIYRVWHDAGPPPQLGTATDEEYKMTHQQVILFSGELDPATGTMIDISPAGRGNNTLGMNDGTGYDMNPSTGLPYEEQIVPAGDYFRVLAEFWADGPTSETPPGHWFTLANYVADQPGLVRQIGGEGPVLNALEWDVKIYLALGGALHDVAITCWSNKGWYDSARPITAIRYMCGKGQSSDPNGPSFHPEGIPLEPGRIEVITEETIAPGERHEHLVRPDLEVVGRIAILAWRGPEFIDYDIVPPTDVAGVGWILGEDWWPYQRPTFVTPPFPGYFSGHSTYSRAAAVVLSMFTGDEYFPGGLGTFEAPQNEYLVFEEGPSVDITLEWARYFDAADESGLSRIYGGIHPPADDGIGRMTGAIIGQEAFDFSLGLFKGQTIVPNVVGLTQAEADTALIDALLEAGVITEASSATVPDGSVISQSPEGGMEAAVDSAVDLVISTGPVVPAVEGMTEDDAEAAIIAAGLTLGDVTRQNSGTVPSGTVISQSPAAGLDAAAGSAVNLVVSSGPATRPGCPMAASGSSSGSFPMGDAFLLLAIVGLFVTPGAVRRYKAGN